MLIMLPVYSYHKLTAHQQYLTLLLSLLQALFNALDHYCHKLVIWWFCYMHLNSFQKTFISITIEMWHCLSLNCRLVYANSFGSLTIILINTTTQILPLGMKLTKHQQKLSKSWLENNNKAKESLILIIQVLSNSCFCCQILRNGRFDWLKKIHNQPKLCIVFILYVWFFNIFQQ